MKLSVVIPFYRELDMIGRAVDSVLPNALGFDGLEILVCNDGSITEEEIRSRCCAPSQQSLKVLPNRHEKGPGGARNTGLDASTGNVIAFLDADDFWLPGKLARQMEALRTGASFVATGYRFDSRDTTVTPPTRIDRPEDVFMKRGIGTSTVVISRELLGERRFRNLRFAQDMDFWHVLAKSPAFRYASVDDVLVEYHVGGSTRNKWVQLQYFCKVLDINDVNYLMRLRALVRYVTAGVLNHYIRRLPLARPLRDPGQS